MMEMMCVTATPESKLVIIYASDNVDFPKILITSEDAVTVQLIK
jgi:hypothetical protein